MSVNIEEIVGRILAELRREGYEPKEQGSERQESVISRDGTDLVIDLADPTLDGPRHAMLVEVARRVAPQPSPMSPIWSRNTTCPSATLSNCSTRP